VALLADRRTTGDPDPAQVTTTTLNGITFRAGRRTAAHLAWTDEQLAAKGKTLRILQPPYNSNVPASKGTHDFDGVVDVEVQGMAWEDAQTELRALGWAAWFRPYTPGLWGAHIHMVSLGCPGPVGVYVPGQVSDYYARLSGLKGHAADPTWHPADIDSTVFDYPAYQEGNDMTPAQAAQLDGLTKAVASLADMVEALAEGNESIKRRITKSKREVLAAVKADE
jgi:hypothetical protein